MSLVRLFTEDEARSNRLKYDFNERLKGESSSIMEETSVFTEYNLEATESATSDLSKSTVLAPFNTNVPDENEMLETIKPLIISKKNIKFYSKLREIDRQYERDNNSNIDNGIYVQRVSTTGSFKRHSARSTEASTLQTYSSQIDKKVLERMEEMGFDRHFVIVSLNTNTHNCASTCYHLLAH